ncbi:MAG TPA: DUF262 domain-containing protein [Thermoanaerobaculia bacterium]|nr:DUF262 domain-containing protein [Thermoanaerobaculia bacterium]
MARRKFDFDDMGIGELLRRGRLAVPPNQRSYAWHTRHVKDLLQDLHAAIQNDDEDYFLGTIVLITEERDTPQIADGQQRLATTTILLARIRDLLTQLKRDQSARGIDGEYIRKIDYETEDLLPQLQLNIEDNDFYANQILAPRGAAPAVSGNRPSNRRLLNASDTIYSFLRSIIDPEREGDRATRLLAWVRYIKDNATVIVVEVPDDVGAFRMFETLNDRGLRASQADILKNYFFSKAGNRLSEAHRLWSGMADLVESLGEEEEKDDDEGGGRLVTYLRHYWILEHGPTKHKELAAAVKSEITGETKALRLLTDAHDAASDYVALWWLGHPKWNTYRTAVKQHLATIQDHLRVEQIRPLLFAVARNFTPEETEKAFRLFVSWSVRFLIYGGRGGLLDRHYSERARDVGTKQITKARELREKMEGVVPSDGEFQAAFATARVSKTYLARYYLRVLDKVMKNVAQPEFVANEDVAAINLEHVLPLTPNSHWSVNPEEAAAADKMLGNMVLLKADRNRDLGNSSFGAKKQAYADSGYMITNEVAKYNKWTIEEIRQRQAGMAKLATEAWPLTFGD